MLNSRRFAPLAALALFTAACATDDVIGLTPAATEGTITVDASTSWKYVSLTDSALVTPAPSARESSAWDIAFFGTNVTLNSGEAGPGGITAACICQNAAATGADVLVMTPESEQSDFDAVTTAPAGLTWQSDVLSPAITGWFVGTGASATADTTKNWLVRLSDSSSFAVVRVKGLVNPTATSAGSLTLEYRLQASAAAALGAAQTITVDLATGAKRLDLNTGAVTTDAASWDLQLDGFTIRVNGGISGNGKGGAATTTTAFADHSTAVTTGSAYRIDTYAGVFGTNRYYRYNIAGDHRISPTFDVYLVRRGSVTYKLQITGYYGPTGTARQITFRWARLD